VRISGQERTGPSYCKTALAAGLETTFLPRTLAEGDATAATEDGKPKAKTRTSRYVQPQVPREAPRSEAIGVLSLGEAAARLGLSRSQLHALIAAEKSKRFRPDLLR